ncbi:unnamed protein product, partial [Notodromas monacha]
MKSDACLRLSRAQHGVRITHGSGSNQILKHESRPNLDGSFEGVIDDVYRNKKNNCVNLRVTLATSGLKTSVYCDIAASHVGNPLGVLPGMKVRISNLVKKTSGSGNHYYVATAMSDFFVGPKVSRSESLWPLVSLSRLLPEKLACVRFLLISFKPWFPVEFEATCDSCSRPVPNESLEGPNCDTCLDSGWVLTASGKFVVSDGTCSNFVLEAKNEQVLQLLGIRGGFVEDFKTFVRNVRVFHFSHRNPVPVPSVLEGSSEFAAKKRMAMQKILMHFRPKNALIVAAKCLLFQHQTSSHDKSGIEGSTFWGRLYCQSVEEVTDFVEIPSDWVRSEEENEEEAESFPFDILNFNQVHIQPIVRIMQLCAILSALLFAAGVSADTKLEEIEARLKKLEMENTKVLAQNRALHLQMDVIRKSEKQLKLQQEGLLSRLEDVEMKQNNETVVAFSIYRTIDYDLLDSVIPYQAEHLNIGGAIDTRVGVF